MMNIVSLAMNFLGPTVIGRIAGSLGMDNALVTKAIGVALPAILGGVAGRSKTHTGLGSLFNMLTGSQGNMLDSFAGMVGTNDQSRLMDAGRQDLSNLLGDDALSSISGAVGRHAGIDAQQASSLLGLVGPVALGTLTSEVQRDGLDARGLASLLEGQQKNIAEAMPHSFLNAMSGSGAFGDIDFGKIGGAAAVAGAIGGAASGVAARAGNAVSGAGDMAGTVSGSIGDTARGAAGSVRGAAGDAMSGAGDMAGNVTGSIGDTARGAAGSVRNAAGDTMSGAGDMAGNVTGSIGNTARGAAGSVGDAASGAVDATGRAVSGTGAAIAGAGAVAAGTVGAAASGSYRAGTDDIDDDLDGDRNGTRRSGGGWGWLKWLIGLLLLAALAWFVWTNFIAPTMRESAGIERTVMVGDTDVGAAFGSTIDEAKASLGSITDEASARAALPDLAASNDRLGEIGEMVGSLGEAQQGAFSGMATTAIETLRPAIENVIAIPGVGPILAPVLESMVEKLGAMAG